MFNYDNILLYIYKYYSYNLNGRKERNLRPCLIEKGNAWNSYY